MVAMLSTLSSEAAATWETPAAPVALASRSSAGLGLQLTLMRAAAARLPTCLYLNAACGRAMKEPAHHRLLLLLVPAPKPKTTRGWQPEALHLIIYTIACLGTWGSNEFWVLAYVATRLLSEIVEHIIIGADGGAPLCAGPTPQKRGPPPLRTGRGGR